MLTLISQNTGQPLFSSNSIYGILDLLLMNWGTDPNFDLAYDDDTHIIIVNGINYELRYNPLSDNPRGEVLISE